MKCNRCIHYNVCLGYRNIDYDGDSNSCPYAEERPQGEWIGGEIGHCSICGSEGCASDIWNGCKDGMYCPNCGADLRKEAENENT